MGDALLAYLHFASIIVMVALLAVELAVCRPGAAGLTLPRLRRLDAAYGGFAALTLGSGVARVLWGAKGSAFYLANPIFHTKVTLFVAVGLLSILPTIQFSKWTAALKRDVRFVPTPQSILRARKLIMIQMLLLAFIPLAATLMARGIGHA